MRNFRSQRNEFAYDDGDNFKKLTNYELLTERPGADFLLTYCGWVQIFDLANESHAKDVQENEPKRSLIGNSPLLALLPTQKCLPRGQRNKNKKRTVTLINYCPLEYTPYTVVFCWNINFSMVQSSYVVWILNWEMLKWNLCICLTFILAKE